MNKKKKEATVILIHHYFFFIITAAFANGVAGFRLVGRYGTDCSLKPAVQINNNRLSDPSPRSRQEERWREGCGRDCGFHHPRGTSGGIHVSIKLLFLTQIWLQKVFAD